MKWIFSFLLISLTFNSELFCQWNNTEINNLDTIGVSKVNILEDGTILGFGNETYIFDNRLGFPNNDSIFFFKSVDQGLNWDSKSVYFGKDAYITATSCPTLDVWYVGGLINSLSNGKILKTIDHGQTWLDVTPPINPIVSYINVVHFYNNIEGVASGDPELGDFSVFHTTDGGNSWTKILNSQIPDAQIDEYSTAGYVIDNCIWFTTSNGRIYKSSDRGYHWEVYQSILNNLEGVSFSDTLNGIALYGFINLDFNTSPIIITSDGGKTWKKLDITPLGPKTGIFGASYIPNSSYIMLTTAKNSLLTGDFATWISPDRGETWQQISSGENIYTINFLDASTGWGGEGQQFAHPTRMFQYTGSPLVGLFSDKVLQVDWDVFPNPTADRVQVRVQEDKPASYLLLVNDLQGKLILRQDWDGTGMLDLDLGACANGLYTLTIASKDGKAVRKLMVAR